MIVAYDDFRYDKYRTWIKERRNNGILWDDIESGHVLEEGDLTYFLSIKAQMDGWTISEEDWREIVRLERENEEKSKAFDVFMGGAIISADPRAELKDVPDNQGSAWNNYVNKLKTDGFAERDIDNIRTSVTRIMAQMKPREQEGDPVKGLVIGNVQSGKTANMAGLISMAADYGWNMFIILSGTIENLRQQTQKRLMKDLVYDYGRLTFHGLDDLSATSPISQKAQSLTFSKFNTSRYLYVCLKNQTRLRNLLKWINQDQTKKKQMRILLIDDEADQAGINTARIDKNERRTINKLIINIVEGLDHKGKPRSAGYASMRYVGYTATPYANLLNEAEYKSLYPKDFISTLPVSDKYFGPQQIFGAEGTDYDGMSIINEITTDDISIVSDIHQGIRSDLPETMKESIAWFLLASASLRTKGYKKPISMLVHTSHKQDHHENMKNAINAWFRQDGDLMELCKKVWVYQTQMFDKTRLFDQYPGFGIAFDDVDDFPGFDDISKELEAILAQQMTHIMLGEDSELTYSNGVHLCVDNCAMNPKSYDDYHVRLAYPEAEMMPEPAPIFIVIGGSTLSRGLTIEGLVSTYFLRTSTQADSLMQMGRWFGYRRNYEIYPRLWLSDNTRKQYEFLSMLDDELRKEIHMMEVEEASPMVYAPRMLNSPKMSFIKITAKNRMQSAILDSISYSGTKAQTITFHNSEDKLCGNMERTITFLEELGEPDRDTANPYSESKTIWRHIDNKSVMDYLRSLDFPRQEKVYVNMDMLEKWMDDMLRKDAISDWNVTLSGVKDGPEVVLGSYVAKAVNRSKKITSDDEHIKIGVLRAPNDLLADIDMREPSEELERLMAENDLKKTRLIRKEAKLDTVPHLIIYVVDKDSTVKRTNERQQRIDMNAPCHMLGICLDIPSGTSETMRDDKIKIDLGSIDSNMEREDLE
jgi:hypothetical protein